MGILKQGCIMYTTDMYEGMLAETTSIKGHNGDTINAYIAKP